MTAAISMEMTSRVPAIPNLSLAESREESSTDASYSSPMGCEIQVPNSLSAQTHSEEDDSDGDPSSGESSSGSSESSLLSGYSTDECETIASKVRGLDRLRVHHQHRDRRLRRMLVGKRKVYEMGLMRQEESARRSSVRAYLPESSLLEDSHSSYFSLETMWHDVLFERHHTMHATTVIIIYSFVTTAFYLLLDSSANYIKTWLCARPDVYYLGMFILGVLILRLSGNLWDWLDEESYGLVKLELHNRERLGYVDAKLHRWLRGTSLKSFANLLGFYLAYWALYNLYFVALDLVAINPLMAWYSAKEVELRNDLLPEGVTATCDSYLEYMPNKYTGMVTYQLCSDLDWSIVQNIFHFIVFVVTVTVYAMLGESFVESVD
jgi:hypothetical protein